MISVASIPIIEQNGQLKLQKEEKNFKESNNFCKSEEVINTRLRFNKVGALESFLCFYYLLNTGLNNRAFKNSYDILRRIFWPFIACLIYS